MGKPFRVGWPDISDNISPIFEHAQKTGLTVDVDKIELVSERRGFREEVYFTGQFIPLRGDSGEIEGFYNTVSAFETPRARRTF